MTEYNVNPEENLDDMHNKHVLFEKLEVVAGVLAGAGTVAVGLLKFNAAAAAMPLTMAVALSYFNRVRMGKMLRNQTHIEMAEVQRRLSSEIQGMKPLGSGEVGMTNTSDIENAVAALAEKIAALEAQQFGSGSAGSEQMTEELVQLRNHQLDLSQSLEAINQQIQSMPIGASAVAGAAVAGVDLDVLRQEFQGLLHPVQQNLVDLESRVTSSAATSSTAASFDAEPLRAELSQLIVPVQQQVHALEDRLSSQPAAAPAGDTESLQQVHGQVSALNDKLDNVAAQLAAEIAGFQQSVQKTQERMQVVHQQVEAVHQNVSAAPAPGLNPEGVQQEVQSVISPLREQLASLEQRLSGLPVADPHAAQLQAEQMVSLQNQLNATNGTIEDMVNHLTQHVTTELSKVPQIVESHVNQKVAQLQPAAPVNKKQDALSELDSILADINL
jgi:predicted  nucleic acid-binding Zn-ribbon protein